LRKKISKIRKGFFLLTLYFSIGLRSSPDVYIIITAYYKSRIDNLYNLLGLAWTGRRPGSL